MANLLQQARNFIPGVQQIFQNAGYNSQQRQQPVAAGVIPRAVGGTGLVAPNRTTGGYNAPSNIQSGPGGAYPQRQGSVLGAMTVSGGSSGSSSVGGSFPIDAGAPPLEQAPDQGGDNFDAIIQPALQSLSAYEATLQPQYESGVQEAEQKYGDIVSGLQGEQTNRLNEFGQQRTRETGRGESAIAEARRQAAELMQGIQARYGGSTGTGAFTSEILGGQATANIAKNRAALQDTISQISNAENALKTEISNKVNAANLELESTRNSLRDQLRQSLADINSKRNELESNKAQMRLEAAQNYRNLLADINARNTSFMQNMYLNAQKAQAQLDEIKSRTQSQYKANITPAQLSSLVNAGIMTPSQAQAQLGSTYGNLQGTFGTQSNDEDLLSQIGF